jgi:hypothetical protein
MVPIFDQSSVKNAASGQFELGCAPIPGAARASSRSVQAARRSSRIYPSLTVSSPCCTHRALHRRCNVGAFRTPVTLADARRCRPAQRPHRSQPSSGGSAASGTTSPWGIHSWKCLSTAVLPLAAAGGMSGGYKGFTSPFQAAMQPPYPDSFAVSVRCRPFLSAL